MRIGPSLAFSLLARRRTSRDLMDFSTYLIDNQGWSSSLYLIDVQAETESVTGTAELTASSYSVALACAWRIGDEEWQTKRDYFE